MDKFGRMSDITTITFTLPKTKSLIATNLLEMLKSRFQQINKLF
jgi:hypothetical protein